ncbi:Sortase family protein, LPXTG-site transpeptidase [Candidatus Sulfopaludibacter sp. SbA3]|nr:Sortase family protein, LPXTG-site transpeptidase [Candidatus Sulfopaludibacter sp. SbA3]
MIIRVTGFRILESVLGGVGSILLATFAGVQVYQSTSARLALQEFDQAQAAGLKERRPIARAIPGEKAAPERHASAPIAVVRIAKANIRVPVFEGTDELALNRGAGWIAGTTRPGDPGNIGIAGHRDGFFRRLKDVAPGDAIELSTVRDTAVYTVDQIEIVRPDNVRVLGPRAAPSLTLVTCYPFDFIGAAPQRYILHATLRERAVPGDLKNGPPGANQLNRQEGDKEK